MNGSNKVYSEFCVGEPSFEKQKEVIVSQNSRPLVVRIRGCQAPDSGDTTHREQHLCKASICLVPNITKNWPNDESAFGNEPSQKAGK
jgi:hypothetical protein